MASRTLKTFRAPSMAEALAHLKRDLGSEAVILHTRTYKTGGWMGLGARQMVEITATDDSGVPQRRPRNDLASRPVATVSKAKGAPAATVARATHAATAGGNAGVRHGSPVASTPRAVQVELARPEPPDERRDEFSVGLPARATSERVRRSPPARPSKIARAFSAAEDSGDGDTGRDGRGVATMPPPPRSPAIDRLAVRAAPAPVDSAAANTLEQELASIKRLMGQVLQVSRQAIASPRGAEAAPVRLGGMPDALFAFYLRLVENGLAPEAADTIAGDVRDELRGPELSDETIVRQTLLRRLASHIPVSQDPPRSTRGQDGRPATLALVGPTGVGKTTTLAKLAAAFKLRHGRRVGLVTCDTYRIAAVEQLRTYANIIGLPLRIASSPQEMQSAIEALADSDVILIDTPGRSQHDATRLGELQQLVLAADPHETHLVLSATASEAVAERIGSRFAAAAPTRAVFTKLDEAVNLGPMFNAARRLNLPVSFVTTGQEVPDDIERANADRLARLLLDGADSLHTRS